MIDVISVRFLLGAAFGLSLGLRNETNGLKGVLYGINVIVFGTSWYDNLHNCIMYVMFDLYIDTSTHGISVLC